MSDVREAMLRSWIDFDRVALSSGRKGAPRPSDFTLKQETERLAATTAVYAEQVGLPALHVRDILQAWRRAGRTHGEALTALEAGLG